MNWRLEHKMSCFHVPNLSDQQPWPGIDIPGAGLFGLIYLLLKEVLVREISVSRPWSGATSAKASSE